MIRLQFIHIHNNNLGIRTAVSIINNYYNNNQIKKLKNKRNKILTMKRTGSEDLALTAALTASSILRESKCLSRYSCTNIFSSPPEMCMYRSVFLQEIANQGEINPARYSFNFARKSNCTFKTAYVIYLSMRKLY